MVSQVSAANATQSIASTKEVKKSTVAYSNRKEDLKADTLELSTKQDSRTKKGAFFDKIADYIKTNINKLGSTSEKTEIDEGFVPDENLKRLLKSDDVAEVAIAIKSECNKTAKELLRKREHELDLKAKRYKEDEEFMKLLNSDDVEGIRAAYDKEVGMRKRRPKILMDCYLSGKGFQYVEIEPSKKEIALEARLSELKPVEDRLNKQKQEEAKWH